jgi:hypothetical protein
VNNVSQYILLRQAVPTSNDLVLRKPTTYDEVLSAVLEEYGLAMGEWRMLTAQDGTADGLVDDAHAAFRAGRAVNGTRFGVFMEELIRCEVEFLCWCGSDYENLPLVGSWEEFVRETERQIADQPADLFLHYRPADAG